VLVAQTEQSKSKENLCNPSHVVEDAGGQDGGGGGGQTVDGHGDADVGGGGGSATVHAPAPLQVLAAPLVSSQETVLAANASGPQILLAQAPARRQGLVASADTQALVASHATPPKPSRLIIQTASKPVTINIILRVDSCFC